MRRLQLATFLALVLMLLAVALAYAQDPASTLSTAHTLVEQARTAGEPQRSSLVQQARDTLARDPALAQNHWLIEPLESDPPDLDGARTRLSALMSAVGQGTTPAVDPTAAQSSLTRILDSPPIKPIDWLALLPEWIVPVVRAMLDFLQLLFRIVTWPLERLFDLLGKVLDVILLSPLVLVLAAAIAIGLVLLYRWGIRSAIVAQTEIAPPSGELPPTAGEALAGAQRLAAEGRYREACHYVFLSTLLWIEEHGTARFDPAATNREHLTRIAASPELARALRPVVQRFDQLWYGQESVTDEDYRDLLALASSLREARA